jgi:hypothetical protein
MDRDSALEREYELELANGNTMASQEHEGSDDRFAAELEGGDGLEREFEALRGDDEFEGAEDRFSGTEFGERFYELSLRDGEADWETERRIGDTLDEIEREYFFKSLLKNKLARGLAGKAFRFAKGRFPALQAISGLTQLARGNLRGALGSLAKTAISMHPAGAAAMQGLRALGIQGEVDDPERRESWERFSELAQEAYEELARQTTMEIDDPMVAAETAHTALKTAMARTYNGRAPRAGRPVLRSKQSRRIRRLTVGPNELIVVRSR